MNDIVKMAQIEAEMAGLRKVLEYLYDGNQEAYNAILWIKTCYKEWDAMLKFLKDHKIYGQKLADLMANESPDGKGYHMGCTWILSRMKGYKHQQVGIKINELKGNK